MDLQQLKEFLNDESKPNEGILQRFILPFGINNCIFTKKKPLYLRKLL